MRLTAALLVALSAAVSVGRAASLRAGARGKATASTVMAEALRAATMLPGAGDVEVLVVLQLSGISVDDAMRHEDAVSSSVVSLLAANLEVGQDDIEIDDVKSVADAKETVTQWYDISQGHLLASQRSMERISSKELTKADARARKVHGSSAVVFLRVNLGNGDFSDELTKEIDLMVTDGRLEAALRAAGVTATPSLYTAPTITKYDVSRGEEILQERYDAAQDRLEEIEAENEQQREESEANMIEAAADSAADADSRNEAQAQGAQA